MKKITIALMILIMSASLVSCGTDKGDKDTVNNKNNVTEGNTDKSDKEDDKDKKSDKDEDGDKKDNEEIGTNTNEDEDKIQTTDKVDGEDKEAVSDNNDDGNTNPEVVARDSRLYFYNGVEDKIYYTDTTVKVIDKALTKALTEGLKSSPNESLLALPSNVGITSAKVDGDTITVDLGSEFYEFTGGKGSSAEIGIIESIALTYSYNFGVSNVRILVGGENYESGHLLFEDGECVNISDIEAIGL